MQRSHVNRNVPVGIKKEPSPTLGTNRLDLMTALGKKTIQAEGCLSVPYVFFYEDKSYLMPINDLMKSF